ncbi:hypothetical protein [Deinococcus sp. PEB2-63]
MADPSILLPAAYAALGAIGAPVRMDGDPDPGGDEVIVLALVSDTTRPAYGGTPSDTLIQVTCYAATDLRALQLDRLARTALDGIHLTHRQMRRAPDPDSIGYLSEFTD